MNAPIKASEPTRGQVNEEVLSFLTYVHDMKVSKDAPYLYPLRLVLLARLRLGQGWVGPPASVCVAAAQAVLGDLSAWT